MPFVTQILAVLIVLMSYWLVVMNGPAYLLPPLSWAGGDILHVPSNAFFYLPSLIGIDVYTTGIFIVIDWFLLRSLLKGYRSSLLISTILIAAILGIFGDDFMIFRGIFSIVSGVLIFNSSARDRPVVLVAWSAFISALCGSSATVWIFFAWLIGILFGGFKNRLPLISLILVLLPPLVTGMFDPGPTVPNYPVNTHLVPFDGVDGIQIPHFGNKALGVELIDRIAVKESLTYITVILLLFTVYLVGPYHLAIVPMLILALDIVAPEYLSQISPLASISRCIPGAFFIPISYFWFLGCLILVVYLARETRKVICLAVLAPILVYGSPLLKNIRYSKSVADLRVTNHEPSPSFAVERLTADILVPGPIAGKPLPGREMQISAFPAAGQEFISDRSRKSRWFSRGQLGREWVEVKMASHYIINSVSLNLKGYETDFPRSLRIVDCETGGRLLGDFDWQGELHQTLEGNLYFNALEGSQVRLHFANPVRTACFRILQTGYHHHYDWSMTGIRVYGRRDSVT